MCYRKAYVVKLVEIAHNMQNVCIYLRRCIHAISTIISTHKEAFLLTLLEQRHGARTATSPPTEGNTGPLKLLVGLNFVKGLWVLFRSIVKHLLAVIAFILFCCKQDLKEKHTLRQPLSIILRHLHSSVIVNGNS